MVDDEPERRPGVRLSTLALPFCAKPRPVSEPLESGPFTATADPGASASGGQSSGQFR